MKKIAMTLVLAIGCLYGANETFKDGAELVHETRYGRNHVIVQETNGQKTNYICKGNVLFLQDGHGVGQTFNPHTGNPYFCEIDKKTESGLLEKWVTNTITVFYSFDQVGE